MKKIERLGFVLTLFLLPHSARWVVKAHPVWPIYPEFTGHLLYLNEAVAGACIVMWVLRHLLTPARHLVIPRWWALAPWLLLIGHCLTSTLWARAGVLALDLTLRWLLAFGFYLYVVNEINDWRWWGIPLAAGAVVQALLAYLQYMRAAALGLGAWGELGVYLSKPDLWVRGYGLSPHPNILGGYLSVGLLALVGGAAVARRGWRAAALAALALVTLGLCSTFSRAAALGGIGGLAWIAVSLIRRNGVRQRDRRWSLVAVLTVLVVCVTFVIGNWHYFVTRWIEPLGHILGTRNLLQASREQENLSERAWYTQAARQMVAERPLWGVGAGNFALALRQMYPDRVRDYVYQPVHNVFYLAAAELGLLGAVWWGALLLIPVGLVLLSRSTTGSVWTPVHGAMLASLLIISIFDYYLWAAPHGRLLFSLSLGIWYNKWYARLDTLVNSAC